MSNSFWSKIGSNIEKTYICAKPEFHRRELVFDIETSGLLYEVSKVWVIAAIDNDTEEVFSYHDHPELCGQEVTDELGKTRVIPERNGSLEDGAAFLMGAARLICHNCTGFDYFILKRFFKGFSYKFSNIVDTYQLSCIVWFDRPHVKGAKSPHGLEAYGVRAGIKKPPIKDWSYIDAHKLDRCIEDVKINKFAYDLLRKDAEKIGYDYTEALMREQEYSYISTIQELNGVCIDVEHYKECVKDLTELTNDIAKEVEPLLPKILKVKNPKCDWEDIRDYWPKFFRRVPKRVVCYRKSKGKMVETYEKPTYKPTVNIFLKNGNYDKRSVANWFDIDTDPSKSDYMVQGAFTKIYYEDAKMSQHQHIKGYLITEGWLPDSWNFKKDSNKRMVRADERTVVKFGLKNREIEYVVKKGQPLVTSPKLTETSFGSIKTGIGKQIAEYNTYMHRLRYIDNPKNYNEDGVFDEEAPKGILHQVRDDGRLGAGLFTFGTSTGRGAQTGIVNLPGKKSLYGKPMRKGIKAGE